MYDQQPHPFSIDARDDQNSFDYFGGNNSSSNSSVATLQQSRSFSTSRSRTRDQHPTPHQSQQQPPLNGFSNPSNSADVTPPRARRQDSVEGAANLNRWSRSTSSSKENTPAQRQRRRSSNFGSPGTVTFGNTDSQKPSPKRLQKSRPSISGQSYSPARSQSQAGRTFDSTFNPTVLPPITTLPPLQTSVNGAYSPLGPSPSTAGLLSAAVHATVPDYFSAYDSEPRDFAQTKRPNQSNSAIAASSSSWGATTQGGLLAQEGEKETEERGHSRNRSGKSSGSTRSLKQPSQKAMLSKALQKANTAVLLDNAQNFEGAMQAYSEACALLQQVMIRSSGDEDRRKLEAIRNTYTSRISELRKITPPLRDEGGKALPARPGSDNYMASGPESSEVEEDAAVIETATVTRIVNDLSYEPEYQQNRSIPSGQLPRRRESLLPSALDGQYRLRSPQELPARSYSRSPMGERSPEGNHSLNLAPPMESLYMPPPLSPRRPVSPMTYGSPKNGHARQDSSDSTINNANLLRPSPPKGQGHNRAPSNESMSWLDTIDESDGGSSVHSRTSSMGVRRKHIRAPSGATEAEFDAALDAAVEAAYDDGFEPMEDQQRNPYDYDDDDEVISNVRRRVELAKERVRQSEREAAVQDARDRERKRLLLQQQQQEEQDDIGNDYEGNESEEEERMLDEMTRGYVMDDFEFGLQSKSALPRESDSSGFSGRTWHSSIGSNPTTAGTMLSTVTETDMPKMPTRQPNGMAPSYPPPAMALPPPPNTSNQPPVSLAQGVRSRRLSGQNAKQLKIETSKLPPLSQPPSLPPPNVPNANGVTQPKTAGLPQGRQPLPIMTGRPPMPQSARQASSPFPGPSPSEIVSPPTPTLLTQTFTNESSNNGELPRSASPGRAQSRTGMRKNFSSSSLKNLKSRNLSVSYIDDASDRSPSTPMSYSRDANGRMPILPTLPTPIAVAFSHKMSGAATGGMYYFDNDIHSPETPGSPNPLSEGAPIPLEPCPTEFLLRPFWLMRALYQTIAHPRGGYLSTKLFVPRDVWRVKGVKIKNVEDKIANCDYLTAALLKLAQVDTYDADAVLEEMQMLEGVLEQVQGVLSKKLGNEVGVQGSGGMFKDASTGGDVESSGVSKSASISSKSSSFSWRRLRSKNSGVNLSSNYTSKLTTPTEGPKEGLTMATLPMTSTAVAKVRFTKRDVSQVQFSGPNANYMGALARLFDAAQAIDQIARQVEDPGLRHADKTQVGLELCTRHAAEFFGFYICRFVLTDLGMLLDKFIKRGSEWVLV